MSLNLIYRPLNVLITLQEDFLKLLGVKPLILLILTSIARLFFLFFKILFFLFYLFVLFCIEFNSFPSFLSPSLSCVHFSNFGLLFGSRSNEDWTTYRILSLALLGGVWTIMTIFFLLVTCSQLFRIHFHLETSIEIRSRVLGDSIE